MQRITYQDFEKVELRVRKIIRIEDFPEARKAAYKLTIDFGPEIVYCEKCYLEAVY